jgi:hypothetical protein
MVVRLVPAPDQGSAASFVLFTMFCLKWEKVLVDVALAGQKCGCQYDNALGVIGKMFHR